MDSKIIFLAILSCINADHLNTELLPPHLPPANVANIFHESGITFVSPTSRNLEISSSVVAPPLPITHAFGFVSHNSNSKELVRTHSFQPITHGLHSSISALSSPNGINSNTNGQIIFHGHGHVDADHSSHDGHVNIQSPPDVVQARFVENENHGVHEINSRTQHFEYRVPLTRTVPQHNNFEQHEHIEDHHHHHHHQPIVKHTAYGVPSQIPSHIPSQIPSHASHIPEHIPSNEPSHIPSQDEIDALPVFQNDKFLSPIVRHTDTPTTLSNIEPPAQTIENIFDTSFHSKNPTSHTRVNTFDPSAHSRNNPTTHTSVNTFEPSAHSRNNPTTHTREHIVDGNNHYMNHFSLSDGTKVSEQGKLISPQVGWENVISKTGEYEYISPEGIPVKVKWIADHEGFRVLP